MLLSTLILYRWMGPLKKKVLEMQQNGRPKVDSRVVLRPGEVSP
jgi:hypothetical protein